MNTDKKTKEADKISAAQFEEAMALYAAGEQREAEINKEIAHGLAELSAAHTEELACLAQGKSVALETVHAYCVANKQTLFSKRRRIGSLHGLAGFRLSNPRLKPVRGADWNTVLQQLKEKMPAYVRVNEEPAKDLLLADRNKEHVAPMLREIGVQVVQEEHFYIEVKRAVANPFGKATIIDNSYHKTAA